MKVQIEKGLEAAGKFPYGFMNKENKQFLMDNVGKQFNAVRHSINAYELDAELTDGKAPLVHIYNAREV